MDRAGHWTCPSSPLATDVSPQKHECGPRDWAGRSSKSSLGHLPVPGAGLGPMLLTDMASQQGPAPREVIAERRWSQTPFLQDGSCCSWKTERQILFRDYCNRRRGH